MPGIWDKLFLRKTDKVLRKLVATAYQYNVKQIHTHPLKYYFPQGYEKYEGWNFNSGNYLFTTDTK